MMKPGTVFFIVCFCISTAGCATIRQNGAVAGGYADEVRRRRVTVVRELMYRPYMGSLLQIRGVTVMPSVVLPGRSVRLGVEAVEKVLKG